MKTVKLPAQLGFSVLVGTIVCSLTYVFGQPASLGGFLTLFITLSTVYFLRKTKKVNFVVPPSVSWVALGFLLGWVSLVLLWELVDWLRFS